MPSEEKGKELIKFIREQMNNNRLSTNIKISTDGEKSRLSQPSWEDIYAMADHILSDSNYEDLG